MNDQWLSGRTCLLVMPQFYYGQHLKKHQALE